MDRNVRKLINTEMKKIIVVDDVTMHLMITKSRLQKHYKIYPVQSADTLFEVLENVTPDLILLDVNMPSVDGYETLLELKAHGRFADIPVIFLTAKGDKSSVAKGMALGAADYVVKPFSDKVLIERIENQLDPAKREANKPVILAVDDDSVVLQSIHYALREKYRVLTVSNPEGLKELLAQVSPDLFLLDYKMPSLTGFDLIPVIRSFPAHESKPIIILTSEGTADNVGTAIRLGACDFLVKPVNDVLLRKKISQHLADHTWKRHK